MDDTVLDKKKKIKKLCQGDTVTFIIFVIFLKMSVENALKSQSGPWSMFEPWHNYTRGSICASTEAFPHTVLCYSRNLFPLLPY